MHGGKRQSEYKGLDAGLRDDRRRCFLGATREVTDSGPELDEDTCWLRMAVERADTSKRDSSTA
jgi:hypothetical protein